MFGELPCDIGTVLSRGEGGITERSFHPFWHGSNGRPQATPAGFDPFGKVRVDCVSRRDPWLVSERLDLIVKACALVERTIELDLHDHKRCHLETLRCIMRLHVHMSDLI